MAFHMSRITGILTREGEISACSCFNDLLIGDTDTALLPMVAMELGLSAFWHGFVEDTLSGSVCCTHDLLDELHLDFGNA
jgi:hypothetical protein